MEKRTRTKLLRFTPDELQRISERARACGQPTAVYIREVALAGAAPKARRNHREEQLLHQLALTGAKLHQLAQVASAGGSVPAAELGALRDRLLTLARSLP